MTEDPIQGMRELEKNMYAWLSFTFTDNLGKIAHDSGYLIHLDPFDRLCYMNHEQDGEGWNIRALLPFVGSRSRIIEIENPETEKTIYKNNLITENYNSFCMFENGVPCLDPPKDHQDYKKFVNKINEIRIKSFGKENYMPYTSLDEPTFSDSNYLPYRNKITL